MNRASARLTSLLKTLAGLDLDSPNTIESLFLSPFLSPDTFSSSSSPLSSTGDCGRAEESNGKHEWGMQSDDRSPCTRCTSRAPLADATRRRRKWRCMSSALHESMSTSPFTRWCRNEVRYRRKLENEDRCCPKKSLAILRNFLSNHPCTLVHRRPSMPVVEHVPEYRAVLAVGHDGEGGVALSYRTFRPPPWWCGEQYGACEKRCTAQMSSLPLTNRLPGHHHSRRPRAHAIQARTELDVFGPPLSDRPRYPCQYEDLYRKTERK